MLGFFAAKSDHPLADAKESKRQYEALAKAEPAVALDDATALLESLLADPLVTADLRMPILLHLDDATTPAAIRFSRSYVVAEHASRSDELKQWRLGYVYWSQLAEGMVTTVRELAELPQKQRDAAKAQVPLLLVRCLHALSVCLKWQQFRYGPLDEGFWQMAGGVYLQACEHKLDQQSVVPYPQQPETTPERMYLKLLAFQASSMDSLLPNEIELADRVLDELLPHFKFATQEQHDSVYWLDASQNLPPTRLAVKPQPSPSLRFFNPGQALSTAEQLRAEVGEHMPTRFNLGPSYTPAMLVDVLDHLALYWSPVPPQRSHPRHQVKSRLAVLPGLADAYRRLLIGARDDDVNILSWIVEDVSQGGMRAQAALSQQHRFSVNTLLLMRPEGGNNWLLGVVRRLSRDTESSGTFGIETLSKQPQALNVDSGGIRTEVLLLDAWETAAQVRVAIPAKAWEDNIPMLFELGGRHVKLVPECQLQAGPDYVIGRYKVRIAE